MPKKSNCFSRILIFAVGFLFSNGAFCQDFSFTSLPSLPEPQEVIPVIRASNFDVSSLRAGTFHEDVAGLPVTSQSPSITEDPPASGDHDSEHRGLISTSVKRGLEDQKAIYLAPFKPSNFKWDGVVLAGTTLLLIEDRHIENQLPGTHYQLYQNASNIGIGSLGATLGGVWLYGIKADNPHARETGVLALETLVNTFLIYTPMQLIAGRQRPGEGNGHGDFFKHHALNTSFPGGHAMFAWSMATVVAHEYSQKWVQALAYTAAFAVTAGRFLGRDHWSSDMFVGTALGIGIGAHIFHSRCDPVLSESCQHDTHFIF